MNFLRSNRQYSVHFTISDSYIRFVQSDRNRAFHTYGQKCLPSGVVVEGQIKERDTLGMIIDEMVDNWKLKGSKMSFCVPNEFVILRKTVVPLEIMEEELTGYLYMQLGESIHLPFEDPLIVPVLLKETEENKEVLLIASKESVLQEFSELFRESSLKPVVADLSMLAAYRTYFHLGLATNDEHVLMVQIGLKTMILSVFHQYKPVFVHHFRPSFSDELFEIVKNRRGAEYYTCNADDETLAGQARDIVLEIQRFISYYRFNLTGGKYEISKLLVMGDHPCIEAFYRNMKESFELEMDVQSMLQPIFQTKKGTNIPSVYTECIGLALK